MFDHVTLHASDRDASERFYETVLPAIGVELSHRTPQATEWDDFGLVGADPEHPVTRHLHVGLKAPDRTAVDAFWHAGTEAGYLSDGEPGPRPQYHDDYYGAFLLDPDANSIEAGHYDGMRRDGVIDHLWIGVADVARSAAFYAAIAPAAHLGRRETGAELARFYGLATGGSFTVIAERPATTGLHMAFGVTDDADVHAFHDAISAAGYRSNGAPGERPEYHPGYYAAFALDPDANNIEVVNHRRG